MSNLLDSLLGDSEEVEIIVKKGRKYVIPNEWVRPRGRGELTCYHCNDNNGLVCTRQKGHSGLHLAWMNSKTGLLYDGGWWEDSAGTPEDPLDDVDYGDDDDNYDPEG